MAFSPAAKTKEELVKEFRRNEILGAACHVIGEHGIGEISMERIAQQAGVAKGTLYLYFENKDALLESTLEFAFHGFIQNCRTAANAENPLYLPQEKGFVFGGGGLVGPPSKHWHFSKSMPKGQSTSVTVHVFPTGGPVGPVMSS